MEIDNKVKGERLQYDISRKAAKISALLTGNIDEQHEYEYLTDEERYHLIKEEQQNKLNLHILHAVKHLKKKQKQFEIKEQNNLKL